MIKSSIEARRAALGGGLAGLTSGVVLTGLMTAMSAAHHKDVWYGMKGAAAPFLGERAMLPGFDPAAVWLGLTSHLAISVGWGVLFALVFYGLSRTATMLAGIGWGFVVWIGMYYAVLPMVGLAKMQHDAPIGRAIAFHLFFSIVLAASYLAFRRAVGDAPSQKDRFDRHAHAA